MNSFKTVAGQDISFESANELKLELQTDVSTNEMGNQSLVGASFSRVYK